MITQRVQVNLYSIVERAVEEGVSYGYHRAFKYTDAPKESTIVVEVSQGVMNALCEVIVFSEADYRDTPKAKKQKLGKGEPREQA